MGCINNGLSRLATIARGSPAAPLASPPLNVWRDPTDFNNIDRCRVKLSINQRVAPRARSYDRDHVEKQNIVGVFEMFFGRS